MPRLTLPQIAVMLITALVLALTWRDALALDGPWDAFFAQKPRASILLALRVGLLVAASLGASMRSAHPRGALLALAVTLLFALSLAFRVMMVPLVIVSLAAVMLRAPSRVSASGFAAFAIVGMSLATFRSRASASAPNDPAEATAYFRRAENPFRARAAAIAWAQREGTAFGEGYIALAEIDFALGHRDVAERVIAKVIGRAQDPAMRARAERIRDSWRAAP
jgi:hypothetical protein